MFLLNDKESSVLTLIDYFKKLDIKDLEYYLDLKTMKKIQSKENMPEFIKKNVYEPEQIELTRLLGEHLELINVKLFEEFFQNMFTKNKMQIKISFLTENIYWTELFVITNTLYISYPYLIRVFDRLESNDYKKVSNVYIWNNKIYDMELLKKISESVISIIQYYNQNFWIELIENYYECKYIDKNKIHFKKKYNILYEPNVSFIHEYIPVYRLGNKFYCLINLICSHISFCPYWDIKLIGLRYFEGEYIEDDDETEINNIVKSYGIEENIQKNFEPNPLGIFSQHISNYILK